MLRFVEGQDFTITDDGTFEADLKVEAYKLAAYYFIDDDNFHDPTGGTKYDVLYEIRVVAEQKDQKPLTAQELWTSKNVVSTQVLNTMGEKPAPFAPRLGYNAVTDPIKSQDLNVGGQGFNGDIHSLGAFSSWFVRRARTPRFWQPATLSSLTTPPSLRRTVMAT